MQNLFEVKLKPEIANNYNNVGKDVRLDSSSTSNQPNNANQNIQNEFAAETFYLNSQGSSRGKSADNYDFDLGDSLDR